MKSTGKRRDGACRTSFLRIAGMIVALILWFPTYSLGQACTGTFSYEVDGVWDVGGSYNGTLSDVGTIDVENFTFDIVQDARGKITGTGMFRLCTPEGCCNTVFGIKGTVKERDKDLIKRVEMTIKIKARCQIEDPFAQKIRNLTMSIKENLKLEIDEASGLMLGTVCVGGRVCVSRLGCVGLRRVFKEVGLPVCFNTEMAIRPEVDGSGRFDITIQNPDGTQKIEGTATLTVSGGTRFDFLVKGKYKTKTDEENLKFKGDPETTRGVKVRVLLDCTTALAEITGGKIGGQLAEIVPPPP